MHQISEMSALEIKALWRQYRQRYDEVGYAGNILDELLRLSHQKQGIDEAGKAIQFWEASYPDFFERFPYKWIREDASDAFDFSVEAAFQVRLIELMIPLWKVAKEYPIASDMFGDILVRQPVVPSSLYTSPQAANIGGHGGIMMPHGWFDSLHYSFESAKAYEIGGEEAAKPYVLELIARTIADMSIKKVHEQSFSLSVHQTISALSRPSVVNAITNRHPVFKYSSGDLGVSALSGSWGDLAYATATFALGHEATHILTGEHKKRMDQADEHRADDIAFDMLVHSVAWQNRCQDLPVTSPIAKTSIATSGFLFVNLLRVSLDQMLTSSVPDQEKRFVERAKHIQDVAVLQQFSSDERETVTRLGTHLSKTRQYVHMLATQIAPILQEAIDLGIDEYKTLLRGQAKLGPEGGVQGLID